VGEERFVVLVEVGEDRGRVPDERDAARLVRRVVRRVVPRRRVRRDELVLPPALHARQGRDGAVVVDRRLAVLVDQRAAVGAEQGDDVAAAVRCAAEREADAEQLRRVVDLPRDGFDVVPGGGRLALAGRLLHQVEPDVHDRQVRLHRDGVGLAVDLDVGEELREHPAAEVLDGVEDVGDVDQAVLGDVVLRLAAHHRHVGDGAGLDRGGELGVVVRARQGHVLGVDVVRLAPLGHLLAEQRVAVLGERDDAPGGELAGEAARAGRLGGGGRGAGGGRGRASGRGGGRAGGRGAGGGGRTAGRGGGAGGGRGGRLGRGGGRGGRGGRTGRRASGEQPEPAEAEGAEDDVTTTERLVRERHWEGPLLSSASVLDRAAGQAGDDPALGEDVDRDRG